MNCPICHAQIADGSTSCPHCGARKKTAPASAASQSSAASTASAVPTSASASPAQSGPAHPSQSASQPSASGTASPGMASPGAATPGTTPQATPVAIPTATAPGNRQPQPHPITQNSAPVARMAIARMAAAPKTATDSLCGFCFMFTGLVCLGLYGYLFADSLPSLSALIEELSAYSSYDLFVGGVLYASGTLAQCFLSFSHLCGGIGGLLLLFAALHAFSKGRGKRLAYAGVVFLLFCLLAGFLALHFNAQAIAPANASFAQRLDVFRITFGYSFLFIYLAAAVATLLTSILLPFKQQAKKRMLATNPIPFVPTTPVSPSPVSQVSPIPANSHNQQEGSDPS